MSTATADRATWLQERRKGIGSTDIAGIIGKSPWASPWSVWVDKVGLAPLDTSATDENDAMVFGRDLEPVIAAWFHRRTGLYVHGEQTHAQHPYYHEHRSTVDGFVLDLGTDDLDLALGVFEAKYAAGPAWPDGPPEHYVVQSQWHMHVTGLPQVWLAAMHLPFGRPHFEVYEIARDEAMIAELADAAVRFWAEHVVTGTPPPTDDHPATDRAIADAAAWITPEQTPGLPLDDHAELIAEWKASKRLLSAHAKDHAELERRLRVLLLEQSEGLIAGQLAVSYRKQEPTIVDVDAVRRDHGDRYDRKSPRRVLRAHEPKAPRRT